MYLNQIFMSLEVMRTVMEVVKTDKKVSEISKEQINLFLNCIENIWEHMERIEDEL